MVSACFGVFSRSTWETPSSAAWAAGAEPPGPAPTTAILTFSVIEAGPSIPAVVRSYARATGLTFPIPLAAYRYRLAMESAFLTVMPDLGAWS